MTKMLLLHQKTFERIADRLRPHAHAVRPVVLSGTGAFSAPFECAAVDAPAPHLAFGSADVWFQPHARTFIDAVLASPRLDWFQSAAAGIEHRVLAAIGWRAGVYTACHVQAEAMAEWALWAALDHLREGPQHRRLQARGEWRRLTSREIAGSHWLIAGFGAIGEATGRRVRALGGHVVGVRRSGGASPAADRVETAVAAGDLAAADVVMLALPLTPQTEGMAGAAFFAAMKPGALFINVGRGGLVDEAALVAALEAGRPGRAALDVVREEPLPEGHPLWRHPQVMLTPHDSAATEATYARADALFLDNLGRWLAGRPLLHVVDRAEFGPE